MYGATRAVERMDLEIVPGEVLGVIGPNGAGKSTLVRIIAGETRPDAGRLVVGGRAVDLPRYSARTAHRLGIRVVHQELALCSNLAVFENFLIELGSDLGRPWRAAARRAAREALDRIFPGSGIHVDAPVEMLAPAQRQMVEIARAASAPRLRLLILDEPTSSLPAERVEQLRALLDRLRRDGCMVILITHRLREVLAFADRIVVMRGGAATWTGTPAGLTSDDLIVLMGGRTARPARERSPAASGTGTARPVLEVRDLSLGPLRHVDLRVGAGEIVGLAGLEGSGQRELLHAIYRSRAGRVVRMSGPAAFVSGDRHGEGIFSMWPVAQNISASALGRLARWLILSRTREREFVARWIERLKLRGEPDAPITSLSGGTQQKTIIARALGTEATLLLLDDPTRGVDADTKQEIYVLLRSAAARGCGVLWYSTEDREVLECDRVYAMARGEIVEELSRDDLSAEALVGATFAAQEPGITATAAEQEQAGRRAWRRPGWVRQRWATPVLALAAMAGAMSLLNREFLTPMGLTLTLGTSLPLVLSAVSQMLVIALGDIDLGIGSLLGLVNVIAVTWLVSRPLLAAAGYLLAVLLYAALGALIHLRRIPAIVATLGTSFVWLGLGLTILPTPGGESPAWLQALYSVNIPVVTEPLLLTVACAAAAVWFVVRTRYGVVLRGLGNNPQAIEVAGWSTLGMRMFAYLLAGAVGVLGGLAVTAVTTSGDATAAGSYTLLSIAAVILGGSEFAGGIIVPVGVVAGAVALGLVNALLSFLSISPNYTAAVEGAILLLLLVGRRLTQAAPR
jgi:ribose transport system ATP-binding protein